MARKDRTKLDRIQRLKRIDPLLAFGYTLPEISVKIGCGEKTIRRDIAWRFSEMLQGRQEQMEAQRQGIINELGQIYAASVKLQSQVGPDLAHLYIGHRIRILGFLARIQDSERLARYLSQKNGYALPETNGSHQSQALPGGRIEIVEGEPVYREDDSDQQIVIELPKSPDDRENCDSATVQMAEDLSAAKRQTQNGAHRSPGG